MTAATGAFAPGGHCAIAVLSEQPLLLKYLHDFENKGGCAVQTMQVVDWRGRDVFRTTSIIRV